MGRDSFRPGEPYRTLWLWDLESGQSLRTFHFGTFQFLVRFLQRRKILLPPRNPEAGHRAAHGKKVVACVATQRCAVGGLSRPP